MSFMCTTCGHPPSWHGVSTYPVRRRPCNTCLNCSGTHRNCCGKRISCLCANLDQTGEEAS